MPPMAPTHPAARRTRWATSIRWGLASIWLFHGLLAKILGMIPRQQAIVARVVGPDLSRGATVLVGVGEVLLAAWIVSAKAPRACAGVMTLMLACMNAFEIALAKDLLLAPVPMLAANVALSLLIWLVALRGDVRSERPGSNPADGP